MGEQIRINGQAFLARLPLWSGRPMAAYATTLALVAIGFGVRLAIGGMLPPGFPFVTFFPAVILSAFLFGLGPGVVAAMLCGALSMHFVQAPLGSLGGITAMLLYVFVVFIDIALVHWMQRANARLSRARARNQQLVERGELLFNELQHRVSNNIQVVAALLTLQKRDIADDAARAAIDDAARRLALIGRIHRQLYDPDGGRLGMAIFLEQLVADLLDAAGKPGIESSISVEAGISIATDASIPVALIVAETVSNALEHGFGSRDTGKLAISLRHMADSRLELSVEDDGRGLPEGFALEATTSLGLRIAQTLARQLGGTYALERNSTGTNALLVIPESA